MQYESQKQDETMTEAEAEQLAVQKRRAEGTPCNKENFDAWKAQWDAEMAQKEEAEALAEKESGSKKKKKEGEKVVDKSGRISGFMHFSDKTLDMEAFEAEAENAQVDEDEEIDVEDEDLFDLDDDDLDDLDDIDFDDDDDDDEPDI